MNSNESEVRIKLTEEDYNKLEKLHFENFAQINFLENIILHNPNVIDDPVLEEKINKLFEQHAITFKEYEQFKNYIAETYSVNIDAETYPQWYTDFDTKELVFHK